MSFARTVKSPQRLIRAMTAVLTGTGTAALSGTCANNMSLTDNGTGDWSITYGETYGRAPEVIVTPMTTNCFVAVTSATTTGCRIKAYKVSDQTAQDAVLMVMIHGSDSADAI